jgi:hypothetical protein
MGAALVQMEKISKSYGPGSHKMDIAPAGSTLLFAEPLIHATGQIRSERERVIIIYGYGPSHFPYWGDGE